MKKSYLMAITVIVCMLAACGSSEDVNAVAAGMMKGSDARSEKDATCLANNLKKVTSNDQWDMLVKINTGEMDDSEMSMEQAMGMMIPMAAAAKECGVELFK